MNAKVIGIIQVKGGAGRSTLSTNLAGELSKIGKTVLIDADMPQGTSASWFSLREQAGRAGELSVATAADHHQLIERVEELRVNADFIVLDGPPRIAEMTRASLMLSDLCLLPVGASLAEIWATADVLSLIEQARKVRPVDARMIWTRHRSRTKLAEELGAQAGEELGLPILKVAMGLRVAYVEALGEGLTAAELPDPNARIEVRFLAAEICRILG
ncbi:MAG: AAA family ATPase [Burkholderiales bacterium]